MMSAAEALVEAKESTQPSDLVRRLLSGMCDAVVHLDANLNLTKQCPKLACLLMRPSIESCRASQPFVDSLPLAERTRFIHHFEEDVDSQLPRTGAIDGPPGRASRLHRLDASSVPVAVEILSSFVTGADNNTFHLVGIKEEMSEQRHFDSTREVTSNVATPSRLTEHVGGVEVKRSSDQGENLSGLQSGTSSSRTE